MQIWFSPKNSAVQTHNSVYDSKFSCLGAHGEQGVVGSKPVTPTRCGNWWKLFARSSPSTFELRMSKAKALVPG